MPLLVPSSLVALLLTFGNAQTARQTEARTIATRLIEQLLKEPAVAGKQ